MPFIGNFKNINSEKKYIKRIITNAKKFIYIEAQYIFSIYKNTVLNHLIKKILHNIVNNTDFIVIIVTNYIQLDIHNTYQRDIFIYKLYKYIKEIITFFSSKKISTKKLSEYFIITYFDDIKIHNKLIISEHEGCFTSSNFLSRSYLGSDLELGLLLDSKKSNTIIKLQLEKLFNVDTVAGIFKKPPTNMITNNIIPKINVFLKYYLLNTLSLGHINKQV